MRFFYVACSLVMALALGSCGGSSPSNPATSGDDAGGTTNPPPPPPPDAGSSDTGTADANETYPALLPHDPPQVITGGGPVLASPKIVPIFFATDDPSTTSSLADFVSKVGATQYWKAAVSEYGVGAATGETPIQLTTADNPSSTIDDTAIQAWLAGKLNSDDPAFPKPDANTVYTLFYPAGITITLGGGGGGGGGPDGGVDDGGAEGGSPADAGGPGFVSSSCTSFGGYHSNIQLDANHGTMNVAYAVLPRCATFGQLTGLDAVTGAASHELIEASTDPYPQTLAAYAQVDDAHIYWMSLLGGGEVGDMCAQFDGVFTKFAELPDYTVQRTWSNKAAKAGQDPCVPALPNEVYFNAAPVLDSISISIFGQTVSVDGDQIAVGQSKTIELDLFSSGPTGGPWTLSALDGAGLRGQTPQLKFAFDNATGQNGDKVNMTVTVVSAGRRNRESFIIISQLGTQKNLWIGEVGN
jgi:hypothetical protein